MEIDNTEYYKGLGRILARIYSPTADDQTIMFWTLQLQFMSFDTNSLVIVFYAFVEQLPRTKHVKRAHRLAYKHGSVYGVKLNQDEHNCIATALAINLAGIDA